MSKPDAIGGDDLPPPSYEEALNDRVSSSSSAHGPPPQPPRPNSNQLDVPPATPARPNSIHNYPAPPQRPSPNAVHHLPSSSTHSTGSTEYHGSGSGSTSGYGGRPTAVPPVPNNGLPFSFPSRSLCSKCKNTGYKVKNGKVCVDCWNKYYLFDHAYNPNPNLIFKYPKRFICEKCENTGIKKKNGQSCKDCYERFAPRNPQTGPMYSSFLSPFDLFSTTTTTTYIPGQPTFVPHGQAPPPSLPPVNVRPGDPRIGGTLCGRCRGTGLIWSFLDEETCPVCGGIGRIIRGPQQYPQQSPFPQPQYAPQQYPQQYQQYPLQQNPQQYNYNPHVPPRKS